MSWHVACSRKTGQARDVSNEFYSRLGGGPQVLKTFESVRFRMLKNLMKCCQFLDSVRGTAWVAFRLAIFGMAKGHVARRAFLECLAAWRKRNTHCVTMSLGQIWSWQDFAHIFNEKGAVGTERFRHSERYTQHPRRWLLGSCGSCFLYALVWLLTFSLLGFLDLPFLFFAAFGTSLASWFVGFCSLWKLRWRIRF